MRFGTLQSIQKQLNGDRPQAPEMGDEGIGDELDFDLGQPSDLPKDEIEGIDDVDTINTEPTNPLADKLLALRSEIDEILADMGYADDSHFDPEGVDSESELGFDDSSEFNFDDEATVDDAAPPSEGGEDDFFADKQLGGDDTAFNDEEPNIGDGEFGQEEEDPNFQGNIRTVAGANLVYKRKEEDGNYEELWIYNVGKDIKKESQIRRAILAGTDIVPTQTESEDGTQRSETSSVGNVQYLKITGLPN